MKILVIADEESPYFWDYYRPEKLKDIELILSCGDLDAEYLTFLATMAHCPLIYVHGNHDDKYDRKPPEGCLCADGDLIEYKGLRILGLGGSYQYNGGSRQYTWKEMERRARKLWFKIQRKGGFDILLTHAPAYGLGDGEDVAHRGFPIFVKLMEKYHPKYMMHGHVHMNYGHKIPRIRQYDKTTIINGYQYYIMEL